MNQLTSENSLLNNMVMSKEKESKKNTKKPPVKNLKEKRADKEAKRAEKNRKSEL